MIFATVNLTIKEDESICDQSITLYRGDRNVQIRFVLVNNIFRVVNQTYAQLVIIRPSKESLFTEAARITDDTVVLTISGEMIDEIREVGYYTFQIRLYDDNMGSRVTLPPCNAGIYVGEPLAIEGQSQINYAKINYSTINDTGEEIDIFDEEGNYNKTDWMNGDIISDSRMNKIEDALYSINAKIDSAGNDNSEQIQGEIDTIKNNIDTLELGCQQLQNDIDSIESNNVELRNDIDALESNNVELRNDIDALESNNVELRNDMDSVESEFEQLKNDNVQIKSDIDTILAMIDKPPTYSNPTVSVTLSNTNIEHSKSYDISITANFVKNDAGNVTAYTLYKNDSVLYQNTTVNKYTDTISITHGQSVTYKAQVTYADGPIKNTSLGIPYPSTSIKSGSVSASNTVRAYALSYYGVTNGSTFVNVNGLTSELRTSKSDTITVSLTNQRIIYMYPKSFGNLTSIKDANNFDYINSYTLSNATVNGVEYNVYILTDPVTITNFKQIYN